MDSKEIRRLDLIAKVGELTDAEFNELETLSEEMLNRKGMSMNPVKTEAQDA